MEQIENLMALCTYVRCLEEVRKAAAEHIERPDVHTLAELRRQVEWAERASTAEVAQ